MKRDDHGIIIQPDGVEIAGVVYDDGGDSAFSTGLSAFAGSEQDFQLMPLFIKDGKLVRHPFQSHNTGTAPHNDPKATSADQVKGFFAGLHGRAHEPSHAAVREACINYARGWTVNSDKLMPSAKYYLYKLADEKAPWWLTALAIPNHWADVLVNCFVNPYHEMTQASAISIVYGKKYISFLYKKHPDLFTNLMVYFGGWRKRAEIGARLCQKIRDSVNAK